MPRARSALLSSAGRGLPDAAYDGADVTRRCEGSRPCRDHRIGHWRLTSRTPRTHRGSYGQRYRGQTNRRSPTNSRSPTVLTRHGPRIAQRSQSSPHRGHGPTSGSASNVSRPAIQAPSETPARAVIARRAHQTPTPHRSGRKPNPIASPTRANGATGARCPGSCTRGRTTYADGPMTGRSPPWTAREIPRDPGEETATST